MEADEKKKNKKTITMDNKFAGPVSYACGFSGASNVSTIMQSGKDGFYEKLNKLNEASGLSIIFNFRETTLDLYLFYEEVVKRGGFNQVTKDAKWGEVAQALHLKSNVVMLPTQLQKVYEHLLLQFEQMYYYRSREKATMPSSRQASDAARPESLKGPGNSTNDLAGKRKFCDWSSSAAASRSHNMDGAAEKRKCTAESCLASTVGPDTPEQKPSSQISSTNIYLKKDYPDAPLRARSAYQMYVKLECERLKNLIGESSGAQNVRDMATKAWRTLSENDRKPYIEASKKDKERYNREVAAYKQHKNKETGKDQNLYSGSAPSFINFGVPSENIDNGYYVTLQDDAGSDIIPDESFIESTVQMLNNAKPSDPIFQIDWGHFT